MENEYISALVTSGLSPIPITEGAKYPHFVCLDKNKKHNLLYAGPTLEEIERWIKAGVKSWGLAGGKVSGNLVTLDFDEKHYPGLYEQWYSKLSDNQKEVVGTCYKSSTRNKGTHLRYRTQTPQPTIKLSSRIEWNEEKKKEEIVTTAETKAEGGYALIPPSSGYTILHGDLLNLPIVPDEIHEELIDVLRTFNEVEEAPATEYEWKPTDNISSDRPGDRLNKLATWNEILEPHGWVEESKNHWRRPGKEKGEGISATTNYDDRPMFYVFSSSASPFQQNKGYSKFHAFSLLNHGGDFKESARVASEKYPSNKEARKENKTAEIKKGTALTKCFSDIASVPIDWLWEGRIAIGKLTMIVGDPGLGKSLVTTTLAKNVSTGSPWPVDCSIPPVGDVIFISAEDDPADTIKPRLEASGANCNRIHILEAVREENPGSESTERMFSLERDIKTLEELLSNMPECRLVIIDPISAYLGSADSNKNSDIRALLAPLSRLAGQYKTAFVLISHLNKNSGENALYRTTGSLAFIAAVRTAYIVTKDKDNPERRLVMPLKNNIAKDTSGFAYSITAGENNAPLIVWEPDPVEMTAQEALISFASPEERNATDEAIDFLRDILAEGPIRVDQIFKQAKEIGITKKPVRSAQLKLGIKPKKSGTFKDGFWEWALPQDALQSEEALSKKDGTLGDRGHLGRGDNLDDFVDYLNSAPEKDKDGIEDFTNNLPRASSANEDMPF